MAFQALGVLDPKGSKTLILMNIIPLPGAFQVVVGVDGAAGQVEGVAHRDPESSDVKD